MKKKNYILLFGLVVISMLIIFAKRNFFEPNFEFIPGMVNSVAANSQSENLIFADKKTSQLHPTNTIAQNYLPINYKPTPEDAIRSGEELQNPFSIENQNDVNRGEKMFLTFCKPCHGVKGEGDGIVSQRGFTPPPSLLADRAKLLKDGQIFHIQTFGQGNMSSFASQVLREDRWKIILHIRNLQNRK